jgi:plastocyanin
MNKRDLAGSGRYAGSLTMGMLILIHFSLTGQKSHMVGVTNNVFTPADITINLGDTVIWTNTEGTHNVNGTKDIYPDNPESFGNDIGVGWTFSHVFTIPGDYSYQCDLHVAFGMTGKITVMEGVTTGTDWKVQKNGFTLYPVPASDYLTVDPEGVVESVSVCTIDGSRILDSEVRTDSEFQLSLKGINPGIYILRLKSEDNLIHTGLFIKN